MTQSAASASVPEDPSGPGRGSGTTPTARHPVTAALRAILIAGAIICTLYVPIYASKTPKIGSWPFFYFYLVAYMPVAALAMWIVHLLTSRMHPDNGSAITTTEAGE